MKNITCPNCGTEYYPQEIFIISPYITNKVLDKDDEGKLLDDIPFNMEEKYKCDTCDKTFNIKMNIEFECSIDDFEEEYTTIIQKPNLFLSED